MTTRPATSKGIPMVIFQGRRFVRSIAVRTRMTVGSAASCHLLFEDPAVDAMWGAFFEHKGKLYAQREGGPATPVERNDAVDVGPFTLVRADPGTPIARRCETLNPGMEVTWPGKEPFRRVVVLGGSSSRADFQRGAATGGLSRPAGLQRNPFAARGAKARPAGVGGQTHYPAEEVFSQAAERAVAELVRQMERPSTEQGELERFGAHFIETLQQLSFPELVAVLRRAATGWTDNYLETFYETTLNRSPMLAFRWAATIAERYAAAARGAGDRVELPRLSIGLDKLISSATHAAFHAARERGGKLIARGPW